MNSGFSAMPVYSDERCNGGENIQPVRLSQPVQHCQPITEFHPLSNNSGAGNTRNVFISYKQE